MSYLGAHAMGYSGSPLLVLPLMKLRVYTLSSEMPLGCWCSCPHWVRYEDTLALPNKSVKRQNLCMAAECGVSSEQSSHRLCPTKGDPQDIHSTSGSSSNAGNLSSCVWYQAVTTSSKAPHFHSAFPFPDGAYNISQTVLPKRGS